MHKVQVQVDQETHYKSRYPESNKRVSGKELPNNWNMGTSPKQNYNSSGSKTNNVKLKSFYKAKDTVNRLILQPTDLEIVLIILISKRGQIPKLYKNSKR